MIIRSHAAYRQALWMPAAGVYRNTSSATVGVLGKTPQVTAARTSRGVRILVLVKMAQESVPEILVRT